MRLTSSFLFCLFSRTGPGKCQCLVTTVEPFAPVVLSEITSFVFSPCTVICKAACYLWYFLTKLSAIIRQKDMHVGVAIYSRQNIASIELLNFNEFSRSPFFFLFLSFVYVNRFCTPLFALTKTLATCL